MHNNPEMIAAILAAILGQQQPDQMPIDPMQAGMQPDLQMAQYGRDYHNNPQGGEYERYPQTSPGITDIPRGPRPYESSQPRGVDPRMPRGFPPQDNGGSFGDDFYEELDRRARPRRY